jgi:hypothetical protein
MRRAAWHFMLPCDLDLQKPIAEHHIRPCTKRTIAKGHLFFAFFAQNDAQVAAMVEPSWSLGRRLLIR